MGIHFPHGEFRNEWCTHSLLTARGIFTNDFQQFRRIVERISSGLQRTFTVPTVEKLRGKNIGFTRLKYLNLSKNAISEIDLNAFDGLADLMVLDLSRNRLDDISAEVFERNENLRILKLSKNNFRSHIPKLRSSSLMELSLDSCQISHLPLDTFNGLGHLRRLDLANNLMIQMNTVAVQTLHFLKKLSLKGNPWSCNKVMLDLQVYLRNKVIEFDEICSKKGNVRKFEKMIVLDAIDTISGNYHRSKIANPEETKQRSNRIETKSNIPNNNKSLSTCQETANSTLVTYSDDKSVAYWFLALGFVLGIFSGLVISYIWLSGICWCNQRSMHEGLVISQLSLVNSYLQGRMDSDGSLSELYPSTPPPAYRDVMLQPSLYRYSSRIPNLNNDANRYTDISEDTETDIDRQITDISEDRERIYRDRYTLEDNLLLQRD